MGAINRFRGLPRVFAAAAVSFAVGCGIPAQDAESIRLADAVVVCSAPADGKAAAAMRGVVAELTNVMFRKTGALPQVCETRPAGAKAAIYLGDAALKASGADLSDLRRGDWRVKAVPGSVYLLGRTPFAVNCAMVEFCRRHCDYHFLTLEGDDPCERDPDCAVPVGDLVVRPAIYCRSVYHGMFNGHRYPTTKRNWERWSRLRRAEIPPDVEPVHRVSSQTRQCHSQYFYAHPDKYFKTHPEYYSMGPDGKRSAVFDSNSQLCYTSEGALNACYESLVKFIEADRAKTPSDYPLIYDFTQHDNCSFMCLCPECKKVIAKYNRVPGGHAEGGDAGLQLEFVNKLARRVREKYPDVQLRVFAYVSTECPPKEGTIKPEPNVVVWWCDVYTTSDHTLPLETPGHFNSLHAKEIDGWLKLTKNVQVWDYMLYGHDFPEVSPDAIAADARFFASRGLPAMFMETEYRGQPFYLLNFYLMGELYVDPTRDVDELVHTYCRVYGAAAPEMEAAISFLRKAVVSGHAPTPGDWHSRMLPWLTRENLETLAAMLAKAHAKPGLSDRERARVALPLASTWKRLVTTLKADPKAALAYAEAQREWVKWEKEVARHGFMEETDRAKAAAKVDEELELLTLTFKDLPAELKSVPAKDLVCLDHHFGTPRVKDERSERGWAVATKPDEKAFVGKLPASCGIYDFASKSGDSYKIKSLPEDGSYAWVKLGPCHVGRNTIFWFPGSWRSSFSLKNHHVLADGLDEDPNFCEAWASARVDGKRLLVDRLVLRRTPKRVK